MTEISLYQGATSAPMKLVEWAHEADAAYKLAESLCRTPFGKAYASDPFGAAAVILKGAEVGLTPVTSLGAFDLIQGQPAAKAITLRALVQSQGHEVWIESSTPSECVAKAWRKGENTVHESKWTIKRATDLGLIGKDNWKKQPQAMLMARATSEVCRLVAADVILGIGYSTEELQDEISNVVEIVRTPKLKAVSRTNGVTEGALTVSQDSPQSAISAPISSSQTVEEPEFDDEPPLDEPEPVVAVPAIESPTNLASTKQVGMIGAIMAKLGMTEKAVAIAYVNDVIGREIQSRNELTKSEASKVIESLQSDEKQQAPAPIALTEWDSVKEEAGF